MMWCSVRYFKIILLLCHYVVCDVTGKDYIVNTEKCKIPLLKPFNNETTRLWFPENYKYCSTKPLLTRVKKTNDEAILYIEDDLLALYGENVTCCASEVLRVTDPDFPDDRIRWTECHPFKQQLKLESDTISVFCQDKLGNHVYRNTHFAIIKNKIVKKINRNPNTKKPISILFVVIDSVSRLNFIRTMPKTRNYILDNGFVELKGYNKIDDNTFPNFMALLTGFNKKQIRDFKCTARKINELDNCPMIWYNFSALGYVTAYGEDWGSLGTFNFYKKGFTKPPTDFYFRPYVLASEAMGTKVHKGAPFCAGPETSGERQLDLALDFSKTFKDSPYFGIFWMNTFSHQSLNTPYSFDDKTREFFINLKAEGILDDSVVIVLSDHGIRMDKKIRKTFSGWFEERLPVNFISVPKWFKEEFPTETQNLKLNSDKLTSTYDLHMTLQHIFSLSSRDFNVSQARACPKCVSLFEDIPARTCSEAGIPEEWCTCIGHLNYLDPLDTLVLEGANFVLNHMKSKLEDYIHSNVCSEIQHVHILNARLSETSEIEDEKYLILHFATTPFAEFIVALKCRFGGEMQENKFKLLFDLIRLDFGNRKCMPVFYTLEYCICGNSTRSPDV